jgi:hypothetical protein
MGLPAFRRRQVLSFSSRQPDPGPAPCEAVLGVSLPARPWLCRACAMARVACVGEGLLAHRRAAAAYSRALTRFPLPTTRLLSPVLT